MVRVLTINDLISEGVREYYVCIACRFCIGYCPVWDALDTLFFGFRRDSIDRRDLEYFAYLCHDCRDCYYACPYKPPHELGINIPRLNSALRRVVDENYVWPRFMAGLLRRQYIYMASLFLTSLALALALTLAIGSFPEVVSPIITVYQVLPGTYIDIIGLVLGIWGLGILIYEGLRYWRGINGGYGGILDIESHMYALRDAFTHLWFRANGEGCDYPGEYGSYGRFYLHLSMFVGFLTDFAATVTAVYYQDVLHLYPPYPLTSVPVILGIVGGLLITIGALGLLVLKRFANSELIDDFWFGVDRAMLYLLLGIVITGFIVLSMRGAPFYGLAFLIHISLVSTLFLSAPHSKLTHIVFRYLALVKYYYDKKHKT